MKETAIVLVIEIVVALAQKTTRKRERWLAVILSHTLPGYIPFVGMPFAVITAVFFLQWLVSQAMEWGKRIYRKEGSK